jgi:hypothetical protein
MNWDGRQNVHSRKLKTTPGNGNKKDPIHNEPSLFFILLVGSCVPTINLNA